VEKQLEDNEIIQAAKVRAGEIVKGAQQDAAVSQREADQYILETLTGLELHLDRLLTQVRNGVKTLQKNAYLSDQEEPPVESFES
jgi:hypothetical protein